MTSAFTGWKFLVNFLLPPPMVLTFLLVLPFPRNVRKGLLLVTSKVLTFSVLGGLQLLHLALVLSGVPLIDSGFRTYKCAHETANPDLTPNQRISVLAKKWREERNFWIAAMAFTLWCLLTVLYSQVNHSMKIHDRLDDLEEEVNRLKGVPPPQPGPTARQVVADRVTGMSKQLQAGAAGMTSKLPGLGGWGRTNKQKAEPASNATEMSSPVTEDTAGVTTRRRAAAAAPGAVSM